MCWLQSVIKGSDKKEILVGVKKVLKNQKKKRLVLSVLLWPLPKKAF